ncbi:MAG: hypothetical protein ACREL7_03365 [Longimicrobiales bacterium]
MWTLFMIMLVAWVVTRWMGVGHCRHERSLGRGYRDGWAVDDGVTERGVSSGQAMMRGHGRHGRPSRGNEAGMRTHARVETPIEKLQRQFASDTITVEQYEHEVGKLYGVKGDA